jgi:uncharacterized phiE125 gp8 family phage protein
MTPIILDGPAVEPVSLAEAKIWLRVDGADEDDLVSTLIVAARLMVETWANKRLISQNWRLVLDGWPDSGILRVPLTPVQAVTRIRTYDVNGVPSVVPPASYTVDSVSEPVRIVAGVNFPAPGRVVSGIEIDLTAGFGATSRSPPASLRQAVLLLVARWYEARGDGAANADISLPPDVAALIAPYRSVRLA